MDFVINTNSYSDSVISGQWIYELEIRVHGRKIDEN